MKLNIISTPSTIFAALDVGDVFTVPSEGGLFIKTAGGLAVVIHPLTCGESIRAGACSSWKAEGPVLRVTELTATVAP